MKQKIINFIMGIIPDFMIIFTCTYVYFILKDYKFDLIFLKYTIELSPFIAGIYIGYVIYEIKSFIGKK